jgi:hypothetical protein
MSKTLLVLVFVSMTVSGCSREENNGGSGALHGGTAEERVVNYLKENVAPGEEVLVTKLLNDVFTEQEEQDAVRRLYDAVFRIPAFVADTKAETGKIPTVMEITSHFNFTVPGTTEVLLRVLHADPRIPPFFQQNPAGEITSVDVQAIRNTDKFRDHLKH